MSKRKLSHCESDDARRDKSLVAESPRKLNIKDLSINVTDSHELLIKTITGTILLPKEAFIKLIEQRREIDNAFQAIMAKQFTSCSICLCQNFYACLRDPYWVVHISKWRGNDIEDRGVRLKKKKWSYLFRFLNKQNIAEYES